jgi:hypothetical protein
MASQHIVFSSLPDDAALCQVAEELIPALRPGGALVETSTASPSISARIARSSLRTILFCFLFKLIEPILTSSCEDKARSVSSEGARASFSNTRGRTRD